jgi:hypothetical protein
MNESSFPYLVNHIFATDIDTQDDFDYAEYLFQKILKPIDNTMEHPYRNSRPKNRARFSAISNCWNWMKVLFVAKEWLMPLIEQEWR